jgi:hypothetical protein
MNNLKSRTHNQDFLKKFEQRTPLLHPWALHPCGVLIGRVFNHPRLNDGKVIVTSLVLDMDENEGWAQTLNTRYRLREKLGLAELQKIRREMRGE